LDSDRINSIAAAYLKARGPLEAAFASRFGAEVPEALNQTHKMLIVASAIDPSSERIIRYLSEHHGVNINAVTFQFFRASSQSELLARVFLTEPSQVEQRTREAQRTKRKPRLSLEELQAIADDAGAGEAYQRIFEALRPHFDAVRPTRSTLNFVRHLNGSRIAVLNLVPAESTAEQGVRFQIYSKRLAELAGVAESELRAALPPSAEPWSFGGNGDPDWSGYSGFWKPSDVEAFRASVLRARSGA
jgi:hypothetical protein